MFSLPQPTFSQPPADDPHRTQQRIASVVNNFYASVVDARGSSFGDGFACGTFIGEGPERATGTLAESEVSAIIGNYVPPPGFCMAAARLRRDRLISIEGTVGSGRRAGAIALLRKVTDGPIVVLSQALTTRDLENWDFRRGYGYAVMDGELFQDGDIESWRSRLTGQVSRRGSYLVVVSTAGSAVGIRWKRPPVTDVLRKHLAGSWPAEQVEWLADALASNLPAEYAIGRVADLVGQVNAGRDLTRSLPQVHEPPAHPVRSWFEHRRTGREIAEATALAFLSGASEQTFNSQLRRLEKLLAEHEPVGLREPGTTMDAYAGYRLADEELMSIERPSSGRTGPVVGFRERGYQRFVLSRLRDTCDSWFWDAVYQWLNRMVLDDHRIEVASGLAGLACASFDEVRMSFLEPWSLGRLGWSGQVTAAYVLWCMCHEESTAKPALETAVQWSGSDDANQRSTAMIAFNGELGARYPTEVARRLWQLTAATDDLCDAGCAALARLFAVLVDQTEQADLPLAMLDRQRAHSYRTDDARRQRNRTVAAVLAVFTIQSHRTGHPAIVDFLRARPDRSDVVARLWAVVLRSQSARREGLVALWRGLQALSEIGDGPSGAARRLGWAVADALLGYERPLLRADLVSLDLELRRDQSGQSTAVLETFLAGLTLRGCEDRPPSGSDL